MLERSAEHTIDRRIQRLVLELNDMSHNGLPAEWNREKIISVTQHAIDQCPEKYRKLFAEKAITLIKTRFHYQDIEKQIILSSRLEKNIIRQIRERMKQIARNSFKTAGFALQWGWQTTFRLVKTALEPAVTQTTLSFSLIVQPLPEPKVIYQNELKETKRAKIENTTKVPQSAHTNSDLAIVKGYKEETIHALTNSVSADKNEKQKPRQKYIPVQHSNTINKAITRGGEPLVLNVERGRMEPAGKIHRRNEEVQRSTKINEIRSQEEIHTILTQNENRFQNCLKPYRSQSASKLQRVLVKFDILPSGTVTGIEFLKGKENNDLNERLKIQLTQLRFSKVDQRLGNQTVFHSFFY